MERPPSALARKASGSNLDFDFLAMTEIIPPRATSPLYIIAKAAPKRQACLGGAFDASLLQLKSRF
jgi:hypothetical protein